MSIHDSCGVFIEETFYNCTAKYSNICRLSKKNLIQPREREVKELRRPEEMQAKTMFPVESCYQTSKADFSCYGLGLRQMRLSNTIDRHAKEMTTRNRCLILLHQVSFDPSSNVHPAWLIKQTRINRQFGVYQREKILEGNALYICHWQESSAEQKLEIYYEKLFGRGLNVELLRFWLSLQNKHLLCKYFTLYVSIISIDPIIFNHFQKSCIYFCTWKLDVSMFAKYRERHNLLEVHLESWARWLRTRLHNVHLHCNFQIWKENAFSVSNFSEQKYSLCY